MSGDCMSFPATVEEFMEQYKIVDSEEVYTNGVELVPIFRMKQWFEHEMTVEQYRQRMIEAFHNADHDELIALVALPTEKEFEHLEWLLKKEWKKQQADCSDVISRQAVIDDVEAWVGVNWYEQRLRRQVIEWLKGFPSAQPERAKIIVGKSKGGMTFWWKCEKCGEPVDEKDNYCSGCGRELIKPAKNGGNDGFS